MRRILENYFKFFGNIDIYKIIDSFPEDEKIVCHTLLSWANDGSHHIYDDLFVDSNQELIQKYFTVFRKIFINTNHQSHFEMMMGNIQKDVEDDAIVVETDQVAATRE
jgi:wobble nucleotide-excising tRNase